MDSLLLLLLLLLLLTIHFPPTVLFSTISIIEDM
jgi:hypothetical protein